MCIIVDANFAPKVFAARGDQDGAKVLEWLMGGGALVYGGKLADELFEMGQVKRYILELGRSGRAFQISRHRVDEEVGVVEQLGICQSDDPHIIALARISGARTLCSHDMTLHGDFKNKALVDGPRGAVYQTADHSSLLKHTSGCRKPA